MLPLFVLVATVPADENDPWDAPEDSFKLEDLIQIPVLSAARKEQPLFDTTTAITVLDGDYLSSRPAALIPDFLRYVPGMQVAQGNAHIFAVTSRGFNQRFANKLLVLQNGGSLNNSPYSGVYWNSHSFLADDLERIEVIRGPGGALWGANAMNGVINILTKPAWDTQGGRLEATVGDARSYSLGPRFGGSVSEQLYYRISAQSEEYAGGESALLGEYDDWDSRSLRMRWAYKADDRHYLMVQGNLHRVSAGEAFFSADPETLLPGLIAGDETDDGESLVVKWERPGGDNEWSYYLQGSMENQRNAGSLANEKQTIANLEFLGRIPWRRDHELSFGAGARWSHFDLTPAGVPAGMEFPFVLGFLGNRDTSIEYLAAYEIGYRFEADTGPTASSVDASLPPPSELLASFQTLGSSPSHMVSSNLRWQPDSRLGASIGGRWQSDFGVIPARAEIDLGVHVRIGEHWKISASGQHLLHSDRDEDAFSALEFALDSRLGRVLEQHLQSEF